MFDPGFSVVDIFHILLLVATCIFCYIAGRIRGATGLVNVMLEYDIINEKDLNKLQKKLEEE
jgi:hypothetical protein